MKSRWKQYLLYASLIIVGGSFVFILIETVKAKTTGFETKTLWDWMQLLIIPVILAVGAFFLNRSERKTEREIAKDRQQEQALQSYLDQMTELLLEKDLGNTENLEIRLVAKTRTLTVLRGLDGQRKRYVLQFLRDARLIGGIFEGRQKSPVFDLAGADLSYADLRDADLSSVNLEKANLQHADLRGVRTFETHFIDADMRYANLQGANPHMSYFYRTDLSNANMRDAIFWDLVLKETKLQFADLRGADFRHSAGLLDVDLTGANLKGAKIPEQHLTAKFLKGATMPDGTKHE